MKITTQTLAEFLAERDLLIVDFEATCWQSRTQRPKAPDGCRYAGEIIEFGAVLISGRNAEIVNEFQAFVRPSLHPELTDFCTELTTIRQTQVDGAESFPAVLETFVSCFGLRAAGPSALFSSWGAYDRNQLLDDCRKHGVDYPFHPDEHLNLKFLVADVLDLPRTQRSMGTKRVFNQQGLEFQGVQHRAIDDARNYAYLLQHLQRTKGNVDVAVATKLSTKQ